MAHIAELPVGSRVHWPNYSPNMKGTVYHNNGDFILVDWDGWSSKCDVQYYDGEQRALKDFIRIDVPRKPIIIIGV